MFEADFRETGEPLRSEKKDPVEVLRSYCDANSGRGFAIGANNVNPVQVKENWWFAKKIILETEALH